MQKRRRDVEIPDLKRTECLTPRERDLLERYYDGDESMTEIARSQGVSRQMISRVITRARLKLQVSARGGHLSWARFKHYDGSLDCLTERERQIFHVYQSKARVSKEDCRRLSITKQSFYSALATIKMKLEAYA